MSKIVRVFARQVLDSRGNPTVQADVFSQKGFGRATAPSGASTGIHEAIELRDRGAKYGGMGVLKAVQNINSKISKAILGMEVSDQAGIDEAIIALDGTPNKEKLGANATTAVSLAVAHCSANEQGCGLYSLLEGKKSIPAPMMNVLNGGKHAQNGVAIQEFMIFPIYFKSFSDALRAGCEIYHSLKAQVAKKYGKSATGLGDEGGFAPPCKDTHEALWLLESAVSECGYSKKAKLAIDAAASSFYSKGKYLVDGRNMSREELLDFYAQLSREFPIISIEDPFHEDDFEGFAEIRRVLSGKVQIVGDDLLVTSKVRIEQAMLHHSVDCLLMKVNQVGTLSEALSAASLCLGSGLGVAVSHRSGESEDTSIADIAVGIGCGQIKLAKAWFFNLGWVKF
ncbi:MAG: phosphopyruvate hydratase [Candidatus Anstonellaceae archaeon]